MTATGALRSASIAGSATLTTDSSTNAMVEPRMVTARTQNFCRATQFGSGRTERIAASSQGRALGLIMASHVGWATRQHRSVEFVARRGGALPTRRTSSTWAKMRDAATIIGVAPGDFAHPTSGLA